MTTSARRSLGSLAIAATAFTGIASTAVVSASSADAASSRKMHSWSNVGNAYPSMSACQKSWSSKINYLRRKHVHLNSYGHCKAYGSRVDRFYNYDYIYYNAPVRMLSRYDGGGFWRYSEL